MNKLMAEALGTFFLVLIGVGAALFAGENIGALGVALAFGFTLTGLAYVIGPVSGCHLNPAVTIGMVTAGRMECKKTALGYIIAQVIGAAIGVGAIYMIAKGGTGLDAMLTSGFAANGFGENSPANFDRTAVIIAEVLATALFILVILGATCEKAPAGFAPIAIGLTLAVALILTVQISNGSINPARSTATALVAKGWALDQLWVFWVAPLAGGILGGFLYKQIKA